MISKFCKLFATLTASRHAWDVWGDWLVMASTALRNGCPEAMRCRWKWTVRLRQLNA